MPIILAQTDTVADCGAVVGCSGLALANTPGSRELVEGAIAGVAEVTVTIQGSITTAAVMFQSQDNAPGDVSWEAGDWVVRINITTSNSNCAWNEVYICRFDAVCGSLATVGFNTGLGIGLGSTGVQSSTVSGSQQTAGITDEIYVVLGIGNASPVNQSFGFTPDQNIDTPIVLGRIPNTGSLLSLGMGR